MPYQTPNGPSLLNDYEFLEFHNKLLELYSVFGEQELEDEEVNFIEDMVEKLSKFEEKIYCSEKQFNWVRVLYSKYCK